MDYLLEGVRALLDFEGGGWKAIVMMVVGIVLIWLAIKKEYEPSLLLPMGFGAILVNLPLSGVLNQMVGGVEAHGIIEWLFDVGINASEAMPILLFIGIGAMIDFGPLLSMPSMFLFGAGAQFGIFAAILLAAALGFDIKDAASIGIIGAADGPTAILVSQVLKSQYVGAIAVAAYSYMALVPVIFPPIIRLLTTKKEREIVMEQSRPVSKTEKILFPLIVAAVAILIVPTCAPLIGCLMLGNLIKESGVVPKITETLANSLMYIVTILLGTCVGATALGSTFLQPTSLMIFGLGIVAFSISAASGVLGGKLMCWITKGKVNPMIGAAGVSAVPMAARVVHKVGREENPSNFLLMHAMGPNVAGVIGSAVAAGILLSLIG
jgi:oxaloacetate decarboxylase beta subunit